MFRFPSFFKNAAEWEGLSNVLILGTASGLNLMSWKTGLGLLGASTALRFLQKRVAGFDLETMPLPAFWMGPHGSFEGGNGPLRALFRLQKGAVLKIEGTLDGLWTLAHRSGSSFQGHVLLTQRDGTRLCMLTEAAPPSFLETVVPIVHVSDSGKIIKVNAPFQQWIRRTDLVGMDFARLCSTCTEDDFNKKRLVFSNNAGQACSALLIGIHEHPSGSLDLMVFPFENEAVEKAEDPLFNALPLPACVLDSLGAVVHANPTFKTLFKNPGLFLQNIFRKKEDSERLQQAFRDAQQSGVVQHTTASLGKKMLNLFVGPNGGLVCQESVVVDVPASPPSQTENHKWQTLGKLAGSVVHDFNNILTAIIGFCDLILQKQTPEDSAFMDLMQIKQSAIRAANLVRQLLFFARQDAPQVKPLHVQDTLSDLSSLLRRLIGERIEFILQQAKTPLYILGDQGQLEQIVLNLAINARDAMHNGGQLTISSHLRVSATPVNVIKKTLPPGRYVVIEVNDTGLGIAPENVSKIFDLFFSTKTPGRGTGLGLATCYENIENHRGGIRLTSVLNKGTQFELWFPECVAPLARAVEEETRPQRRTDRKRSARILIVEDEDPVRSFGKRALSERGYEVYEAKEGSSALEMIYSGEQFDLIISDIMMPNLDGLQLAKRAHEFNSKTKVLFVSGYSDDLFESKRQELGDLMVDFLPKPFNIRELTEKITGLLSQEADAEKSLPM